jgi:DNA-directed RNA polymerase subunit alpha
MKWKNVLMPKQVEIQKSGETPYFTRFTVEPLERGFGLTLGNALRRTLLSSLQGAAVVAVKFEDALHEFTNIPGVMEDVSDIVINLKQLVCRLHTDGSHKLYLDVSRPGPVTARDITEDSAVEIVNPDFVLCHLNEGAHLRAELLVGDGRGFVLAENHELSDTSIGVVPVDAIFCPVRRVNYRIEGEPRAVGHLDRRGSGGRHLLPGAPGQLPHRGYPRRPAHGLRSPDLGN